MSAGNPRVLLADDDEVVRSILRDVVIEVLPGAEVIETSNGFEAFLKMSQGKYNLLITDIRMPGVDGLNLLRALKKLDQNIYPDHVLVMSAFVDVDSREREMAYFTFMPKPFTNDVLRNYLRTTFGL